MLEINNVWTSTGSSGGLTAVELRFGAVESILTLQHSTLATTTSFSFQTAQESSGPWFTEGSTAVSTGAAGQVVLRVTGPYTWMRPFLHTASTGALQFRLVAVS